MSITSFNPPVRTLMGPGPSDVHPRVTGAMARPCIGHLDPAFIGMMDEVKTMLQYAFQTSNQLTIPVSAPGSAGMETTFQNVLEHCDKVIICQNGVFGGRMKEVAERCVLMMLNEAARCLDEGVIRNARDGDIGAIFGIGFPPFLGGPFRYMDTLGIKHVVARLNHYATAVGDKFAPAEVLVKMAENDQKFYS